MGNGDFRNAVKKIGEYIQKFSGIKPSFTEESSDSPIASTQITYSAIATAVSVAVKKGQTAPNVVFSTSICQLPKDNLVAFFRQLLTWNNFATDVAHFSINDEQGIAYLVLIRPFENFEYAEFKYAVEMMSTVAANAIMALRKQFNV